MIVRQVFVKAAARGLLQRDGAGRHAGKNAPVHQPQRGVLHDLGVHLKTPEAPLVEGLQHGVAHAADPGLDGPQPLRQAPGGDLALQKVHDVFADPGGDGRERLEAGGLVRPVRQDDGGDLLRRAGEKGRADPVRRGEDVQRPRAGRQADLENVVHAEEIQRQRLVDLHDHLVRRPDDRIHAADRGCRDQAIFGHGAAFDNGKVDLRPDALGDLAREVGDVHVAVADRAGVDGGAHIPVGLVSEAAPHQARAGQRAVQLVAHRGADADRQIARVAALCQRQRHGFGVAHQRKAAHSKRHAAADLLRGLLRRQDLFPIDGCDTFHGASLRSAC